MFQLNLSADIMQRLFCNNPSTFGQIFVEMLVKAYDDNVRYYVNDKISEFRFVTAQISDDYLWYILNEYHLVIKVIPTVSEYGFITAITLVVESADKQTVG